MNPFRWLREAARQAVLGGISDALEQAGSDPAALTVRVELPAIEGGDPAATTDERKKRKAG